MKLRIATIVLDGMPFITCHLPVFNKLPFDWQWDIAEGVSKPVADTSWVKPIPSRLSNDGTTRYLDSIAQHPRVRIHRQPEWPGKCAQINACCEGVNEGDVVLQVDSDEIWTARQIELIVRMLTSGSNRNGMIFRCRYFLGPDIIINSKEGYGNHEAYEWRRAWLAPKDFRFVKHEPPEVNFPVRLIGQEECENMGLVFDHFSYATEAQVFQKEIYYGYKGAVLQWTALQRNTQWPVKVSKFLSWVKDDSTCTKLYL
jgi:glycosyltransferase involved in cell wall biosynthesis